MKDETAFLLSSFDGSYFSYYAEISLTEKKTLKRSTMRIPIRTYVRTYIHTYATHIHEGAS